MKNLLLFFNKIRFLLFFIVLQMFVFFLVQRNSSFQQAQILNSSASVSGWLFQQKNAVFQYFNLRKENEALSEQNAQLKQEAFFNYSIVSKDLIQIDKQYYSQQYLFQPAVVIQNSTSREKNILTLDVGTTKQTQPEMGVVNANGIVGFVRNVSDHYSSVMSLMNVEFKIPVKPLNDSCVGTLQWLPTDKINEMTVKGIPSYFSINKGDTIITQGGSGIFPQGEIVGVVTKKTPEPGSKNQVVKIKTAVDFYAIHHVFVVTNLYKTELDSVIQSFGQQ